MTSEVAQSVLPPEVTTGLPPSRLMVRFVRSGFDRANKQWPLALLLLVINIVSALGLVLPVYGMLDQSLGRSLLGEQSLEVPDVNWLTGFLWANRGSIESLSSAIVWVAAGYMLLQAVLAAGVLETLAVGDRFSLRMFLYGFIRHGWKFLCLFGLALVVYFVIFWVFNGLLTEGVWFIGGLENWTRNWASEGAVFVLYLVKNLLLGAALLLAVMVFDYAKIRLVLERTSNVLTASWWAVRFVRARWRLALGVFYGLGLAGAMLVGLYLGIEAVLPATSLWWVLLLFVLQQLSLFSRFWLRVAFYAAQMEVYKELNH
jgi:hypothetical protein